MSELPPPTRPRGVAKAVLGVAAVTLLALGGVVAWGGGDLPDQPTGIVGGDGPNAPAEGGAGPAIGGSSSASGQGPAESSAPLPPFDATALIPVGGVERPPSSADHEREWRVPGRAWPDVLADYQRRFPVPGWELGSNVITIADGTKGKGFEIQAVGRSRLDGTAGEILFRYDPDDARSTIVSYAERK